MKVDGYNMGVTRGNGNEQKKIKSQITMCVVPASIHHPITCWHLIESHWTEWISIENDTRPAQINVITLVIDANDWRFNYNDKIWSNDPNIQSDQMMIALVNFQRLSFAAMIDSQQFSLILSLSSHPNVIYMDDERSNRQTLAVCNLAQVRKCGLWLVAKVWLAVLSIHTFVCQ